METLKSFQEGVELWGVACRPWRVMEKLKEFGKAPKNLGLINIPWGLLRLVGARGLVVGRWRSLGIVGGSYWGLFTVI